MLFHKSLVRPPRNPCCLHRITFSPKRNLMSMQIVEAQFVQKSLLDDFVGQKEEVYPNGFHQPTKTARQMSIDEYCVAINAIAGDVGNVVLAIDDPNSPTNGSNRIEQHIVLDVFRVVANFPLDLH